MHENIVFYEFTSSICDVDRYSLIEGDDGFLTVEHAWLIYNARGTSVIDEGETMMPVDRFLSGDHDETAQKKLREHLSCQASQGEIHAQGSQRRKAPR
jgi:hypothetical protein